MRPLGSHQESGSGEQNFVPEDSLKVLLSWFGPALVRPTGSHRAVVL